MLHLLQVLLSVGENCVHVGLVFLCLKRRGAEGRSKGVLREQQTNVNVPTALASKDWIISLLYISLLLLLLLSNIDIKYLPPHFAICQNMNSLCCPRLAPVPEHHSICVNGCSSSDPSCKIKIVGWEDSRITCFPPEWLRTLRSSATLTKGPYLIARNIRRFCSKMLRASQLGVAKNGDPGAGTDTKLLKSRPHLAVCRTAPAQQSATHHQALVQIVKEVKSF